MRSLLPLALAAATAACATTPEQRAEFREDLHAAPGQAYRAAQRIVGPPQLSPVQSPAELTGRRIESMPQPEAVRYEPQAANSLWRGGSRSFFNDQRATRVGDILTVNIEISDKAELSNSSNRQRTSSTGIGLPHVFGLENIPGQVLPSGFDPSNLVEAEADSSSQGQGSINREEKIRMTVAAVIVDILPNGNLVVAGRQEVRINAELRELTVSGVIRPEDVAADNTIRQDQIAEARISYGGRGQISSAQRPGWGQRVVDAISPW